MASAPAEEPLAKQLLTAAEKMTAAATAVDTTMEVPTAAPVLNIVLIKIGKDGRYTPSGLKVATLLTLDLGSLLLAFHASPLFARRLQDVDLTDVDVHLLRSVAGKLPTEAEELNFVDLVAGSTIASELSQIDLGTNGWLYILVVLPATPAALPATAAAAVTSAAGAFIVFSCYLQCIFLFISVYLAGGPRLIQKIPAILGNQLWNECTDMVAYVEELLTAVPETVGSLQIFHLKSRPLSQDLGTATLIMREPARHAWDMVWAACQTPPTGGHRHRWAIVGNPGIGKSRGLVYLLRLALLENKTVIFEARGIDRVFAFLKADSVDGYRVFFLSLGAWNEDWSGCPAIGLTTTVYLVDPKAMEGKLPNECAATTIFAASLQAGRFHKHNMQLYGMPSWTLAELMEAHPYFGTAATPEQLAERFALVGGVPRLLLWPDYQSSIQKVKLAASNLNETTLKSVLNGDISNLDDSKVPSALFMLVSKDPQKEFTSDNFGLDFVSEGAMFAVCDRFAEVIIHQFNSALSEEATLMGHLFERIAIDVLCSKAPLTIERLTELVPASPRELKLKAQSDLLYLDAASLIARPSRHAAVPELVSSWAQATPGLLLVPRARNFPVIDAVAAVHCSFQMTIAETHPISGCSLQRLLPALADDPEHPELGGRLRLVFVVPWYRYPSFRAQSISGPVAARARIQIEQWKVCISVDEIKTCFRELVAKHKV
jgi:hypothetical protein